MSDYSAEAISNLFEPDVVLPSQFCISDIKGIKGGERKLMAALLSDGIEAFIAHHTSAKPSSHARKPEVCEWVETRDFSYVFSFDVVCECLGINPEYLRLGLARYVETAKERAAAGDAPKSAWKKIRRPRK